MTGPTGRYPSTGATGSATSSTNSPPVPRPHACRSSGRAAAASSPCADADGRVQRARHDDRDVDLRRRCPAACVTPPSGATFSTATSAAPSRTTRSGSSALRMLSSAATGTSTRRRTSASSGTVAHGCSTYSSGPSAVSAAAAATASSTRPAAVGVDPHRRHQCANGVDPCDVVGQRLPGSATFTLAVRAPGKRASTSGTCAAATAGTVALIGMRSRSGDGGSLVGGFDADGEPVRGLGRLVLEERAELAPAAGPSISATSRT